MNKKIIQLESVTKEFSLGDERSLLVLKDISLDILENDFISLVGPSGSGKTTLLRIIATLLKPTKGKVKYKGEDITHYLQKDLINIKNEIGYISQQWTLEPYLTVWENVQLVNEHIEEEDATLIELIEMFSLQKRLNNYPYQLSGGEYRKAMLLIVLLKKPKIIIADEPTANVDIQTAYEIIELLKDINKQNIPIIFSTHARELASFAKKRLILKNHRLNVEIK
ncbi:MAG: ABC transporter ATP-binding protein [Candidatus Heimdallarchaeaceae archaeon]